MLGLASRTIPYVTGLLRGKKAVDGILKAKQATQAAKSAMNAGVATRGGVKSGLDLLIGEELMRRPGQLAWRVGPDAAFAALNAASMPGDPLDKGLAFGTEFGISALPGLSLSRAAKRFGADQGMQLGLDMIGSYGGAFASYPATDALLRMKGGGMTPYEKLALQQQQELEEQLRQKFLIEYGLSPYSGTDPYMVANGLSA